MNKGLTHTQRLFICFTAGVIGGLAVALFSQLLFNLGISQRFGVDAPAAMSAPDVYRPLIWGGIWGIPFGLVAKSVWSRLYTFGFLYFLAPVVTLYLVFLPVSGLGLFGLDKGPLFPVYLLLVNVPYGIVTAVFARTVIGRHP